MSTSRMWLDRESFGTIFLYFNLKQKTIFPSNVGHAYSVNKGCNLLKRSVFATSKMDRQLLRQKVRQRISVIPENWNFNSLSVLKTTKRPMLVFITYLDSLKNFLT